MTTGLIIFLVVLAAVIFYAVGVYNKLVVAKNKVLNQFSQVDVQLKRRTDLIPNLVETVKGYAAHEKETFEAVIAARNACNTAEGVNDKVKANNALTGALNKLFAVAEAYPELKANENFLSLQADLKDAEDKIAYARQFYNDTVLKFNNLVELFPSNIIAGIFNFEKFEFFKIEESEKAAPKVQF